MGPASDVRTENILLAPDGPLQLLLHCPCYEPTPLQMFEGRGKIQLLVKDETMRMGLGSFKALGGAYAVAKLIRDNFEIKHSRELLASEFNGEEIRTIAKDLTFLCASAGNHGLSVAAGANIFGAKARVYLSRSVPRIFEKKLCKKNAIIVRSGDSYEESLEAAIKDANETGAILVSDTSWKNYIEIPRLVMDGYTVIAEELRESFEQSQEWPSVVFVQAGVGGLAAAMSYIIQKTWAVQPRIVVVEPVAAPCLYESHRAGKIVHVTGPVSCMGRLDCKVPSLLAYKILQGMNIEYQQITDEEAKKAVDDLRKLGIRSTPSGSAGLAAANARFMTCKYNQTERVLIFATEGHV